MLEYYGKVHNTKDIPRLIQQYSLDTLRTYKNMPGVFIVSGEGDDFVSKMVELIKDPAVYYLQPPQSMSPQHVGDATVADVGLQDTSRGGSDVTWHLEYLTRRPKLPGPVTYDYAPNYTGAGVNAYVIDSGIRYSHEQVSGRALELPGYTDPFSNHGTDGFGHGTHVAGIIGGETVGVAPGVTLYSARVFDNSGNGCTTGQFLDAIDKVITHHRQSGKPAVANLSLASNFVTDGFNPNRLYVFEENELAQDDYLDDSVRALAAAGITVCVAAGNGLYWTTPTITQLGLNAKYVRPARVKSIITVGAISPDSSKTSFSNYGVCVNTYAPGDKVFSSYVTTDDTYAWMSGTSMATPCIAGLCALLLQQHPKHKPAQIQNMIDQYSSRDEIPNLVEAADATHDGIIYNGIELYSYSTANPWGTELVYEPGNPFPNMLAVLKSINGSAMISDRTSNARAGQITPAVSTTSTSSGASAAAAITPATPVTPVTPVTPAPPVTPVPIIINTVPTVIDLVDGQTYKLITTNGVVGATEV